MIQEKELTTSSRRLVSSLIIALVISSSAFAQAVNPDVIPPPPVPPGGAKLGPVPYGDSRSLGGPVVNPVQHPVGPKMGGVDKNYTGPVKGQPASPPPLQQQ